jgi:LmbE family N-acetylglucosaminyl deacetylase
MFDASVILVLAPHTDDGELGCGGSIAKFIAQGKQVHYTAFSTCAKSLSSDQPGDTLAKECKKATALLGIPAANLRLMDFEVRIFPSLRQQLLEEMVSLNQQIKPDLVLMPCSYDVHQDHATIHTEANRAFKSSSILGFELPWNQTKSALNYFIQLNEEQVAKKIAALKAYTSQSHRLYMKEEFTRSLALVRGVQAGASYAEAFEVCRIIHK